MLGKLTRKGSIFDPILFPIKTLITIVALLLVGFLMTQFGEKLEGSPLAETQVGNESIQFMQDVGNNNMPKYFVTLFAFDILGIIATSFMITLGPIFVILYILFMMFAVALAVFSMIFYNEFSEVTALQAYVANQGMANYIMQYSVIITLVVAAISAIIIMSKTGNRGGNDL